MADYTLPTVDELTELGIAYWGNLLPEDDLSRASDEWARIRVKALLAADINHNAVTQLNGVAMPDTATGDGLVRWGVITDRPKKGATVVTGANVLRVRGTVGAVYTIGLGLTHGSGLAYQTLAAGVIPAEGYADVSITSVSTGAATRLTAGQILRFDAPPTGIEQNAELLADLVDGGDDEEGEPAHRERVRESLARPNLGSTDADWKSWALKVEGVASAYVYPGRNGLGSVDVAAFKSGTGEARSLTTDERNALAAVLETKRTLGARVRVLETVGTPVDVRVVVYPMPNKSYAPDWNTGGVDLTVDAWNPTTRVLTLSDPRPGSINVGHRIVVDAGAGTEGVVAALGPAADEVTIVGPVPSGFAPEVGAAVYPGGSLVAAVRTALTDWINTLGPRLGSYGTGWKGALYLGDVLGVIRALPGVLYADVEAIGGGPFTTAQAPEYLYPDDDKVGYLVPGRLAVSYTDAVVGV